MLVIFSLLQCIYPPSLHFAEKVHFIPSSFQGYFAHRHMEKLTITVEQNFNYPKKIYDINYYDGEQDRFVLQSLFVVSTTGRLTKRLIHISVGVSKKTPWSTHLGQLVSRWSVMLVQCAQRKRVNQRMY